MQFEYLNGMLEDLEHEECFEIDGGGAASVVVVIAAGTLLTGCGSDQPPCTAHLPGGSAWGIAGC